jgi:hypothetical protein
MDQLIIKYRQLQAVERDLQKRMLAKSNRLKAYRDSDGNDEIREIGLQNDYEKSRDSLSDIHGRLNQVRGEISRNIRWRYERLIYDLERGPQSGPVVAEIMRLAGLMKNADHEAARLLD